MPRTRPAYRWFTGLLIVGLLSIPLVACAGPAWESHPDVQQARIACAGLRRAEHLDCIEEQAVASLNPAVCHLVAASLDTLCLRAVYEAAGDAAICEQIYLPEVKEACQAWFDANRP
ncbi:MAG: hypothetical protein PVI09_19545 [Anaerolineae bacterium]|jgi:hypothetical protein